MTVAEKSFERFAKLYQDLIKKTLVENKVKRVNFISGSFARKYTHVIVNEDGTIKVFLNSYPQITFNDFLFDFTSDYAALLNDIERDLFITQRCGNVETMMFDFR